VAVHIRLRREGKTKKPAYRVVVADSRAPRDGRFIEAIGYYNPLTRPPMLKIDGEKASAWIKKGARDFHFKFRGGDRVAVHIRLRREGKTKKPAYRVVVADSRAPRDGRFIEAIGYYNPLTRPPMLKIDGEKVSAWLKKGAQPSNTVRVLLARAGIGKG